MKIIDYKIVTKDYEIESDYDEFKLFNKDFEQLVKKYIEKGYTPIGGITLTVIETTDYILMQSLVLYEK